MVFGSLNVSVYDESSANSLMFELIESVMSFMYNRKRIGSRLNLEAHRR